MPLAWTLLLNVPLGLGAWWVAGHSFRQPSGLSRALAAVTLAWAWATLGMEILGAAGVLSRGPLLGWVLLGLAIGGVLLRYTWGEDVAAGAVTVEPWGWDAIAAVGLIVWASLLL